MILSNLIKSLYYQFPDKIKIKSDLEKIRFELDYHTAEKVAKKLNWLYYFGTEIRFSNEREFKETFRELLKVKKALKEIYAQ